MFVPLPSTTISELATSHRTTSPARQNHTITSRDEFFAPTALQPDPLYMGLRAIVASGPIGRLTARFSTWREEREERRFAAEQAVSAAERLVRRVPTTTDVRDGHQHDLAA